MNSIDKKILVYLSEKDVASESAVINETFKDFNLSKKEYIDRLTALQKKDYIRYERPFGNGAFIKITEKGRTSIKSFLVRFNENLTLIVAILSIFFGIISSVASIYTIQSSMENNRVSNLRPLISFMTDLNTRRGNGMIQAPQFSVKNEGTIPAVQVQIDFSAFEYSPDSERIEFGMSGEDQPGQNFLFNTLEPRERRIEKVDGKLISIYINKKTTLKDVVIEASLQYGRERDRQMYYDTTYYLINKDGEWVSKDDPSLADDPLYQKMLSAIDEYKLENNW